MAEEGLNEVRLLGRLTEDAALRFTQANNPVLSFRLACSKSWFDKDSKEKKEKTEFINCVLWGKRGESLSKFLTKGSRIHVSGEMQTRMYEKDGQKHYPTEVNVNNVVLLGSKGEGAARGGGGNGEHTDADAPPPDDGDQIPF